MESLSTTYGYQNKKQTCTRWLVMIAAVLLFAAGTISCSQKFPIATTNDVGILVVPLQTSDDNPQRPFLYSYLINYSPETPANISIRPSVSKEYIIIDNFPIGTYQPQSLTTNSNSKGHRFVSGSLGATRTFKRFPKFRIKPNYVTFFPAKIVISKYDVGSDSWTQHYKLEKLDQENREDLIKKLKNLENADQWKFE